MTKIKPNDSVNEITEKAKNIIAKGNARHVVIRSAKGDRIAEFSMTVAAIGGMILFFMAPWGWMLLLAAGFYGMMKKVRVELVRDISDDDDSIEIDIDK
ncbi:MAG: DUF4342 domain-containing protein [Anaerolineae bacterium]|nr:DUF4342 domain-containing protein [Anaerolineae bacterium]MDQ7035428.1 DUF4342 domain-containing protein [Anaerolineae bacterium]